MPGVALEFGKYGLMSKIFVFMWSLYLLVGPWAFGLSFVLSHIVSITTDMGTELGFLDAPNILPAFLIFLTGSSFDLVTASIDMSSRLFSRALRITGWGHLWGNFAKAVTRNIPNWPSILSKMQNLCRFFRNRSWRRVMIREGSDLMDGLPILLKSFKAKFLKWRYESVFTCFLILTECGRFVRLCWQRMGSHGLQASRMASFFSPLLHRVKTLSCGYLWNGFWWLYFHR